MPRRGDGALPVKRLGVQRSLPGRAPMIMVTRSPPVPSKVYDSYWMFAAERQRIFFRRLAGATQPWTSDPVLATYKFTNAYRASDRVSQFLLSQVIYRPDLPTSAAEVVFRILLFKMFNRIDTWQLLEARIGELSYARYDFELYDAVLTDAMRAGRRIYSAAYIMPPGREAFGHVAKHRNQLRLLETMIEHDLPARLQQAQTMRQGFDLLLSYPTIGNFLAYQFITDINYSELTGFSEMEFVMAGPGARDGLRKCFYELGEYSESDVIRRAADMQEAEFERLGLAFDTLWGRRLQLVDCQNLFCEISKYARVAHPEVESSSGRTRIKQKYRPGGHALSYWYPPKWGINDQIGRMAVHARLHPTF